MKREHLNYIFLIVVIIFEIIWKWKNFKHGFNKRMNILRKEFVSQISKCVIKDTSLLVDRRQYCGIFKNIISDDIHVVKVKEVKNRREMVEIAFYNKEKMINIMTPRYAFSEGLDEIGRFKVYRFGNISGFTKKTNKIISDIYYFCINSSIQSFSIDGVVFSKKRFGNVEICKLEMENIGTILHTNYISKDRRSKVSHMLFRVCQEEGKKHIRKLKLYLIQQKSHISNWMSDWVDICIKLLVKHGVLNDLERISSNLDMPWIISPIYISGESFEFSDRCLNAYETPVTIGICFRKLYTSKYKSMCNKKKLKRLADDIGDFYINTVMNDDMNIKAGLNKKRIM